MYVVQQVVKRRRLPADAVEVPSMVLPGLSYAGGAAAFYLFGLFVFWSGSGGGAIS